MRKYYPPRMMITVLLLPVGGPGLTTGLLCVSFDPHQKHSVTLQSVPQQGVQLRVELRLLLQHVKEELVLGGARDLRLLQPALHHLHLRLLLGGLQTLHRSQRQQCL